MNILSQLVDRRMLSYQTALEELGFDYPNELANMETEFDLVEKGIFGIIGSPWQQAKVQPNQRAPQGSPSQGRPSGQPAKKKQPQSPNKKSTTQRQKQTKPQQQQQAASLTLNDLIDSMSNEEFIEFQSELNKRRILGRDYPDEED
jgi:hypothetical protein